MWDALHLNSLLYHAAKMYFLICIQYLLHVNVIFLFLVLYKWNLGMKVLNEYVFHYPEYECSKYSSNLNPSNNH